MSDKNENGREIPEYPYEGKENFLYFSYSQTDYLILRGVTSLMANSGFRIWHDGGIPVGNWEKKVTDHIETCKVFICFLSEKYLSSENTVYELNSAIDKGKLIIPVFLENINLPESYLSPLCNFQSINAFEYNSSLPLFDAIVEKHYYQIESCRAPAQSAEEANDLMLIQETNVDYSNTEGTISSEGSEFPYEGNDDYIFISYRSGNIKSVLRIVEEMNQRGFRVWYDEAIHQGVHWRTTLVERIRNCKVFVCFVSKEYITSIPCFRELILADESEKIIVPIMLDKVSIPDHMAYPLSGVHRINAYKFDVKEKIVDDMCSKNGEVFQSCRRTKDGVIPPPPPSPPTPWKKIIIAGALIALLILGVLIYQNNVGTTASETNSKSSEITVELTPAPTPLDSPATQQASGQSVELPAESASPISTPEPEVPIQTSVIKKAGKQANSYLTSAVSQGCPLPSYENQSDSCAYDNAVAALALLSEGKKEQSAKILDALVAKTALGENSDISFWTGFPCGSAAGVKGSVAVAMLRYFKEANTYSYVNTAKAILDSVIESSEMSAEVYSEYVGDNIWLYTAFKLLGNITGEAKYDNSAETCRSQIESSYTEFFNLKNGVADECIPELQAMVALALNDRRGMEYLISHAVSTGKYLPSGTESAGVHAETACTVSLAFGKMDKQFDSATAMNAVIKLQQSNGSVPETDTESIELYDGTHCRNIPRISASAWTVMAANSYNCFSTD